LLAEGKKVIITFHSYKGGTGKTLLSTNLALILANRGKKICLLDLDFSAPSLHAIFQNVKTKYWMNDYLDRACEIDKVLKDCSLNCVAKGKLFVGLANPSAEAIRNQASKDIKREMEALCRLLSLKNFLLNDMGFEHVIFDTSPGLQYSSINAVVSADAVFAVTTMDKSDMEGTQRMTKDLYQLFARKTAVILNKVPFDFVPEKLEGKLETLQLPVAGAIPCSCDILKAEGEYFFASKKPNHVLTRTLREVASKIGYNKKDSCSNILKNGFNKELDIKRECS
jgi:MinD-like ATPase involved in chromosome partitioning or flagellar assembly